METLLELQGEAQGDFESTLNSIEDRQNELIRTNNLMLEWFTLKILGDNTSETPQPSFPEYTPSNVGYPYELVNLKASKSNRNKK